MPTVRDCRKRVDLDAGGCFFHLSPNGTQKPHTSPSPGKLPLSQLNCAPCSCWQDYRKATGSQKRRPCRSCAQGLHHHHLMAAFAFARPVSVREQCHLRGFPERSVGQGQATGARNPGMPAALARSRTQARALECWTGKFGFRPVTDQPMGETSAGPSCGSPMRRRAWCCSSRKATKIGSGTFFNGSFTFDDVEATCWQLKQRGVEFLH